MDSRGRGMGEAIIFITPSLPSPSPSLTPLVQVSFSTQPSTAVKIKDGSDNISTKKLMNLMDYKCVQMISGKEISIKCLSGCGYLVSTVSLNSQK